MNKAFTIIAVIIAFFILLYSPKILSEFYLWNASLSEFFAERAYYIALNLGAENLHREETTFTLQNGKHVYVAFTCVDLFMIGFNAALPLAIFILVLASKNILLTLPQTIIIFLIMLLTSILMNVIRIALLLYLANIRPDSWMVELPRHHRLRRNDVPYTNLADNCPSHIKSRIYYMT